MNDVRLQSPEGIHPLDENLRPLKIGILTTPLELSHTNVGVSGDLEVDGSIKGGYLSSDLIMGDAQVIATQMISTGAGNLGIYAGSEIGISLDPDDGASITLLSVPNDATDYFQINVGDAGSAVITTNDSGGAEADLTFGIDGDILMQSGGDITLDAAGDIILDAQGGNITLLDGGSTYTPTATSDAVPLSHLPYVLYSQFQDDLGTAKHYLPLKGYFEQSLSGNEPAGMIAPFNMKLQKIVLRCSEDISGATWKIGMWAIDSGSTHAHHHTNLFNWIEVTGGAADTNATFDFTGTVGLTASASGGSNAVTAGQWIDFAIQSDTDVTSSNAEFWITMFFIADLSNTV